MNENDLEDELLALARRQDIEIINIETEDDSSPDVAFPFIRKIMMNPNFDTSYAYNFRLAHEITHVIYADKESLPYYRFSPFFLKEEENSANDHAIELIVNMVYKDVPTEQRNWLDFMNTLGLQSQFESTVKQILYK